MRGHTEGEWFDDGDLSGWRDGRRVIIARFWTRPAPQDLQMIIAAPDMYEALKKALLVLYSPISSSELIRAEAAIRAALAKAGAS